MKSVFISTKYSSRHSSWELLFIRYWGALGKLPLE